MDRGNNGNDGHSLLSIPSVSKIDKEEEEEIMDGRNADGNMAVSGVVVPNDVYVPAFADDVSAVA